MNAKGFANPELLITSDELRRLVDDPSVCIVDTRPTHEFAAGHIPGAVHVDLFISLKDTRDEPFRAFMGTLGYVMRDRGVDSGKRIVFYENDSGMRAARGFWICEYFGIRNVQVLDRGLKGWRESGGPVSTACPPPPRGAFAGTPVPSTHIGVEELRGVLGRPDHVILDVRTPDEYYGRVARASRGGAIPGAVHVEWTRALDEKGGFRAGEELRTLYAAAGVEAGKQVICYCQGGYRSAHTYLALRLIGNAHVRNYIGSWWEWGDRSDLPIEIPQPSA